MRSRRSGLRELLIIIGGAIDLHDDIAAKKEIDAALHGSRIVETTHPFTQVAPDELNRHGISAARGKQWHATQVLRARHRLGSLIPSRGSKIERERSAAARFSRRSRMDRGDR
jgi:hypothetical protein